MSPTPPRAFLEPGRLAVGCNYWASHAGTAMWRDWRPAVVEADLAALKRRGLELLRVFPLWPDFQPITELAGHAGAPVEMRVGEAELPLAAGDPSGLCPRMLARFESFVDIAEAQGLRVVVALVTGWMSGRLFVPPGLARRNVLTDPVALAWQTRFVRGFVQRFRGRAGIAALDLGNECNCMGVATRWEEAYHWTATIAHAIRAADATRPVISGMHSLSARTEDVWRIADQAELTDFLTTHPYPYWVAHGRLEPLGAYRTQLLPTIETCLYADIGGKPCIAEEIGSMGPMVASDEDAGAWLRFNLLSLWAHGSPGCLWWCGFDQTHLAQAPYDWLAVETELGLLRGDGTPKPALREFEAFARWSRSLPFETLPPRRRNAVCVLSRGQDAWAVAIGAFTLAKQVGLELRFVFADQPLPESDVYLLPALSGLTALRRHEWLRLTERVREGATLYLSLADGLLPDFEAMSGLRLERRSQRSAPGRLVWPDGAEFAVSSGDALGFSSVGAEVLARDETGGAAWAGHRLGKGRVFTLAFPLELQLALQPGALEPERTHLARRIYGELALAAGNQPLLACEDSALAITEHSLPDGDVVLVVLNPTARAIVARVDQATGWSCERALRGAMPDAAGLLAVPARDAVVLLARPKPAPASGRANRTTVEDRAPSPMPT